MFGWILSLSSNGAIAQLRHVGAGVLTCQIESVFAKPIRLKWRRCLTAFDSPDEDVWAYVKVVSSSG